MKKHFVTRPFLAEHWPQAAAIYWAGLQTGQATFTTELPEWDAWNAAHLPHSRLVACDATERVLGWAALSPVSSRAVYAGVAEVSIYVATRAWGQGVGRHLLTALVAASEQNGLWTLQASIFPENLASVRLHTAAGFRQVGYRERISQLRGHWRDTLLLERRSAAVGTIPAPGAAPFSSLDSPLPHATT